MNTINRAWLKRQVAAGKIIAKCDFHLTDDYRFDDANNFGKTGWLPARIRQPKWENYTNYVGNTQPRCVDDDFVTGAMNLLDHDFEGKAGRAYRNPNGEITLRVHSNLVYTLREI